MFYHTTDLANLPTWLRRPTTSPVQPQGSVICLFPWGPHNHGGFSPGPHLLAVPLVLWLSSSLDQEEESWIFQGSWVGLTSAPPAQLGPSAGRRQEQPQLMLSCLIPLSEHFFSQLLDRVISAGKTHIAFLPFFPGLKHPNTF